LPATFIHDRPALKDPAWLDEVMAKYGPSSTIYHLLEGPDGACKERVCDRGRGQHRPLSPATDAEREVPHGRLFL